jgi:hypothetical protein
MQYKTRIKCYQRKNTKQYLITLTGKHPFHKDQTVYILPAEQYTKLNKEAEQNKQQTLELEQLKKIEDQYNKLTQKYNELETMYNKTAQKYNAALIETKEQAQDITRAITIISFQKEVISEYNNQSLIKRIFGKAPERLKELEEKKEYNINTQKTNK